MIWSLIMFPESDITETLKCEGLSEKEARLYSPLTLAFLGDAVYSLLVRDMLTSKTNKPAGALHKESITLVNAASQAAAARRILPLLSQEELAVFKRGRNAHSAHSPKNQSSADYRCATGLEALYGYLFLCKNGERISYLFNKSTGEEYIEKTENQA